MLANIPRIHKTKLHIQEYTRPNYIYKNTQDQTTYTRIHKTKPHIQEYTRPNYTYKNTQDQTTYKLFYEILSSKPFFF